MGGQGFLRTKSLGPLVREARDPSGSWKPPMGIPGEGARKADARGVLDLRGGAGGVVDGQVVAWRELTRRCSAGEGMCEDEARALRDGADWRKDAPDECRYKLCSVPSADCVRLQLLLLILHTLFHPFGKDLFVPCHGCHPKERKTSPAAAAAAA